jgi:hypothetical protein
VALLWKAFLEREISACVAEARRADLTSFAELNARQAWYKHKLEELGDPGRRTSAVGGLLACLAEGAEEG